MKDVHSAAGARSGSFSSPNPQSGSAAPSIVHFDEAKAARWLAFAAMLAAAAVARPANANVLVWDPQGNGAGSDATGTWTTDPSSPPVFDSPTLGLVVWDNTANAMDTAQFGSGTAGSYTVNLGSNITAGGVVFNAANAATNYSIVPQNSSVLTLTTGAGFTVNTGASAATENVTAPVVVSLDQTWSVGSTGTLAVSGGVTGSNGLTKTGAGALILGGTTAFTSVALNGGRLSLSSDTALPTGTTITASTGVNSVSSYASGSTPFLVGSSAAATQTIANNIVLPSTTSTSYIAMQRAQGAAGGSLNLSGSISGGSSTTFLQLDTPYSGDSTTFFELSGNNSALTATQIRLNRGRVQLDTANALGTATLYLQSNANAAGNMLFGAAFTLTNPVTFGTTANNAISTNGFADTISGKVTTSVAWTKTGTGALTLNNTSNSITGAITISGGSLFVTSAAALGSAAITATTGAASSTAYASGLNPFLYFNTSSAVTASNNITLPSPTTSTYYAMDKAFSGKLTLSGIISGGNANTILQLDSQSGGDSSTAFELSNTNTFTGTVRLNRGRLILDNAAALGTATLYAQSNANATAGTGNVMFNGTFTFPNNITLGTTSGNTFDVPALNTATLSGAFTTVSGSTASWVKQNTGTMILTNAADAFNGVSITGGTLRVDAAIAGGTFSVGSGATLAGVGNTGAGTVSILSGGIISPGTGATTVDSAGTFTTGAETWNTGGKYVAKLDASGKVDTLVMSSLTTVQSGFVLNAQTATGGSFAAGTYVLAVDTSGATGTDPFGTGSANGTSTGTTPLLTFQINGVTAPAGYSLTSATDSTSGVDLDLVVAPEPGSLLLASTAIVPLLSRRLRRRASRSRLA